MSQSLFPFEQTRVDSVNAAAEVARAARTQAKLASQAQRAIAKRQAEIDKSTRRFHREMAAKARTPDEHAQCGIRWYCRSPRDRATGNYWTHCHACGQALIYTSDPNAKPQVCAGRRY